MTRPKHITFLPLHTLVLGYLDPNVLNVVGKWELPYLKELSMSRWNLLISTAPLPLIQRSFERLESLDACIDLLHDRACYDIIRAPPIPLRYLTLSVATSAHSSPPMLTLCVCTVQDADKLDAIGALGMMRCSTNLTVINRPLYGPTPDGELDKNCPV